MKFDPGSYVWITIIDTECLSPFAESKSFSRPPPIIYRGHPVALVDLINVRKLQWLSKRR